jgi:predicted RNA binding protein YcfA (HicA-like mRNA interferase family)
VRLPRDLSGADLAAALKALGYELTRTSGSHMRLTSQRDGEHHITIPKHDPLKTGTLAAILSDLCAYHGLDRDELLRLLLN